MADETSDEIADHGVRPWVLATLALGIVVGFVLLMLWGAAASPSGGCGG